MELTKDEIKQIYEETKTIAVVGASSDESKPSHRIPKYLQSQGFKIIPVSPKGGQCLGEKVYAKLADIPEPVDVVDVFRPADETPQIARDAVAIGAKVLWLQSGIANDEAEGIAEAAGLKVVMDRCMGATHRQLGLGPGPD
ncbi:MAG: CoA-binding protein [Actinomycetota bacterium]